MESLQQHQERADKLAYPMFCLSLVFLVLLAALIVLWVDIPRVVELAKLTAEADETSGSKIANVSAGSALEVSRAFGRGVFVLLLLLWPLFIIEYFITIGFRKSQPVKSGTAVSMKEETVARRLARAIVCLVPPLRLAAQSPAWDNRIWLPVLHWQHPGRTLSKTLERIASKPMLLIALLILPILLIEFVFSGLIERYQWLRTVLHVCTGFIWCAFTIEFIIMVSATDKKLAYVKKNWIDLAIILLPLLSFLRSIRVLRIAKLAKVQKLAKMGRVYRMRGLLMKVFKAMVLVGFVHRLLRVTPEKKLRKLKMQYEEKTLELEDLQAEIDELELEIGDQPGQMQEQAEV